MGVELPGWRFLWCISPMGRQPIACSLRIQRWIQLRVARRLIEDSSHGESARLVARRQLARFQALAARVPLNLHRAWNGVEGTPGDRL
jgi:hypothetical protein